MMYLKYFGLSDSSFRLAPDPRCFYFNRAYRESYLALHYVMRLAPGLVVLTGESGVGKTTLIRMVKDRCDLGIRVANQKRPNQRRYSNHLPSRNTPKNKQLTTIPRQKP